MLTVYKCDGDNFHELSLSSLLKNCWINLTNPTGADLQAVHKSTDIPLDVLKAALDEEETSRIELEDKHLLVLTNIPINRGETIYETLPLGIILTCDELITVCLEDNPVLADFNQETKRTFNTAKRTRFMFQILFRVATLFLKHLRHINRQTDQIEVDLRKTMKNKDIFQLMDLQKALTYFSASLRTNGIAMDKLLRLRSNNQAQDLIRMYEEDEDLLEDVIIENNQAIQMVEMYTNILSSMTDTFASIISNNLNIVMKFLASMTIILAIPTMLASFWGMNVQVPFGAENPHGFFLVLLMATAVTGIIAFVLWKKKILR